jgi:hypothetical protein
LHIANHIPTVSRAARNFALGWWFGNMASIGRYCGDFLSVRLRDSTSRGAVWFCNDAQRRLIPVMGKVLSVG